MTGRGKQITFREHSVQERIEAIISGACSSGPKALALFSMGKSGRYTNGLLNSAAESTIACGLPFKSPGMMASYCRNSLEPSGFVTIGKVKNSTYGKSLISEFSITEDGERYGKPAIERFILLSHLLNLSLERMNGSLRSPGEVTRGYVVARTLEALNSSKETTVASLSKRIGISGITISANMKFLREAGFIEYESVKIDPWNMGEFSGKGFSSITLEDTAKLDGYLADIKLLKADTRKIYNNFRHWGDLINAMRRRDSELDAPKLAGTIGIPEGDASKIITILARLEIYKYQRFIGNDIRSIARITEQGRMAYRIGYKPVILVAEAPDSSYVTKEYPLGLDRDSMGELFRAEMNRYILENKQYNATDYQGVLQSVSGSIKSLGRSFRQTDVGVLLRNMGQSKAESDGLARRLLAFMRKEGIASPDPNARGHYILSASGQ